MFAVPGIDLEPDNNNETHFGEIIYEIEILLPGMSQFAVTSTLILV